VSPCSFLLADCVHFAMQSHVFRPPMATSPANQACQGAQWRSSASGEMICRKPCSLWNAQKLVGRPSRHEDAVGWNHSARNVLRCVPYGRCRPEKRASMPFVCREAPTTSCRVQGWVLIAIHASRVGETPDTNLLPSKVVLLARGGCGRPANNGTPATRVAPLHREERTLT